MTREVQAAGAVVWRERGRKLQVLLVHRPGYNDWSWPKGKAEDGESLVAAAVREVEEETGYRVVLGQPLEPVRYRLPGGRLKESSYWAARVAPHGHWTAARPRVRRASRREIDEIRWVDAAQARRMLTYARDRAPLEQVVDQWDDGRLATWTVVIARHGRAKKRSAWKKGGEETRPLTDVGVRQASCLVPMLSAYGVERVITSPWERCSATVAPYAHAAGIEMEERGELTEAAHEADRKAVRRLVDASLSTAGEPLVVCTHRPVLPTVISQLTVHTQNKVMRQLPERDPWLKTGEIIVAHMTPHARRGAVAVAFERHRPYSG